MPGAWIRRTGFWILDALQGGQIKAAYEDITKIDHMNSDDLFIAEHQAEAFQNLKKHAVQTTAFYRPYAEKSLQEFPIITKNDIRKNQADFLSSSYEKEKLIQMATSGSTGTPFVCYQNSEKKRRVNAEIIYYTEKVGYKLGENLSYIRSIVKQNKKSGVKQFMQNQSLIDCVGLGDEEIECLLKRLGQISKREKVTLLAYASTYTAIKNYCRKHRVKNTGCEISGMISGSEMLYDDTREAMETLFHTKIVSRYSNEENGVLGQDEGLNNIFVINEADYIVEIVDDNGNKLPDGTLGRIVVTDLYNTAMPMIRYDTGDVGAVETVLVNGRKKRAICNFSGRAVDVIYDVAGRPLSPYVITNNMWSFPEVKQFQVIQKDRTKYIVRLNVDENFSKEKDVIELMRRVLGAEANITVERVDEIPVLASGKRRYIVNEWER